MGLPHELIAKSAASGHVPGRLGPGPAAFDTRYADWDAT